MRRSIFTKFLYQLIRNSAVGTFLLFGTFPRWITAEEFNQPLTALLILISIMLVWGMAEGTVMLWHKARSSSIPSEQARARGFKVVTLLAGLLIAPLIFIFRERVSQPLFVALLVSLSFRGISRTAWDQGKCSLAVGTTFVSTTILAALSFALFRQTEMVPIPWQGILISIALACTHLAVEMAWNNSTSKSLGKREMPLFRLAFFAGPVIVGTLAFIGQLPLCYSCVYLLVPFIQKVATPASARGTLEESEVKKSLVLSGVFLFLLGVCRSFENGWFGH